MTEEQTPPGVQDPAPAAQPVAPPPNPGPWADDLAQFTDPAIQAQVDQLLRTKIQPRMTRLEQDASQAAEAQRLMNDLVANPAETMAALAAELQWQPEAFEPDPEPEGAQMPQPVDPRVEEAVSWFEQQKVNTAYEQEMQRILALQPDVNQTVFHAFVAAGDGDFDIGLNMYNQALAELNPPPPAEEQVAPPTLGGDAGATTPPTEAPQLSLGDAIKSFMNDQQPTSTPPPIS